MDQQTRDWYMQAMGIPVWVSREPAEPTDLDKEAESFAEAGPATMATVSPLSKITADLNQQAVPQSLVSAEVVALDQVASTQPLVNVDTLDWQALQQTVAHCQQCSLHKTRTQTVFGTGDQLAQWMIIGEAPGAEEDRQGLPFVGRAGQLLTNMLRAAGLKREQVYIANTLKCRPPHNRDPLSEESAACRPYLERQLALVKPALLIAVGRIAAHNVLQTKEPLGRLRGKLHRVPGTDIPLLITYHPAYLLRRPSEKHKAWQDLQLALKSYPPGDSAD